MTKTETDRQAGSRQAGRRKHMNMLTRELYGETRLADEVVTVKLQGEDIEGAVSVLWQS